MATVSLKEAATEVAGVAAGVTTVVAEETTAGMGVVQEVVEVAGTGDVVKAGGVVVHASSPPMSAKSVAGMSLSPLTPRSS